MVANGTNSNKGYSLCILKGYCSFISAPRPVPLPLAPKGLFWPRCALAWSSALSHHIVPPHHLSAQVEASHSDIFLGSF